MQIKEANNSMAILKQIHDAQINVRCSLVCFGLVGFGTILCLMFMALEGENIHMWIRIVFAFVLSLFNIGLFVNLCLDTKKVFNLGLKASQLYDKEVLLRRDDKFNELMRHAL